MGKLTRARKKTVEIRHYFVAEGGDSTLFAGKGKVIIETSGCSRFFVLGLLDVRDPDGLQRTFDDLWARILNDLYFKDVPSMQAEGQATTLTFHAKDDLPEVRKKVFTLLRNTEGLRYFAVVADKWSVLECVRLQNECNPTYRYQPNEQYDYLTRRLFKNLLHKNDGYEIVFSKRGKSDRTAALRQALEAARLRFAMQWNVKSDAPIHVSSAIFAREAGLQAVDYFTWALQRLYEKREDRYLKYLWQAVYRVQDIDDRRKAGNGMIYTQRKPLNAAALAWRIQNRTPGI